MCSLHRIARGLTTRAPPLYEGAVSRRRRASLVLHVIIATAVLVVSWTDAGGAWRDDLADEIRATVSARSGKNRPSRVRITREGGTAEKGCSVKGAFIPSMLHTS